MSVGKEKCEILKRIRKDVADRYGVEYNPTECNHSGDCSGVCPKCDAELKELQRQLELRGVMDIDSLNITVDVNKNEDISILEGDVATTSSDDPEWHIIGMPAAPFANMEKRRVLYKECQIAGITFRDLEDVWDELYEGAKLALVREKYNKHDKYAVAVALADDYDGDTDDFDFDYILGYVPRAENKYLATMMDLGWAEAFECELSQINGSNPYRGSLLMKIFMVSKDEEAVEDISNLLRVIELDRDEYEGFISGLEMNGCAYFRYGRFPLWERKYPKKGEKVVFMHREEQSTLLYLMHCIAVGDEDASYFVEDKDSLFAVDDCCYYVFTNIKGPIRMLSRELDFLAFEKINRKEPEEFLSEEASLRVKNIFVNCVSAG